MKKIRLKICDLNLNDKFSYGVSVLGILEKHYEVELSENPEYVIYHPSSYEYLKYDCIRILLSGENITANFNLCDYAVGCDYLTFGDRFYRMPLYLLAQFYTDEEMALAGSLLEPGCQKWSVGSWDYTKQQPFTREDLAKKTSFCSFIYRNYLADPAREDMFKQLSLYKKVDAGGQYLNNLGGMVENKLAFELQHKFSIAFENSSRSGYTTEKLVNALVARTIPIYWGNPDVHSEFNQDRFVNCHAYGNFNEAVARIKEIDRNDELYLKIINQPIAATGAHFQAMWDGYEKFLCHIFDQPLKAAKRRTINTARAVILEDGESWLAKRAAKKNLFRKLLAWFYRPFKKIGFFDKFKQRYLAKKIHLKPSREN